ncbi:MAG: AAA family ATPase [Deltaproteobacteria bacterium]|nr:AAA family ATPase [Deltaproteobacteria bacterium]
MNDAEKQELESLSEVLAAARLENPAKQGSDLKVKATRMRRLAEELKSLAIALGKESTTRLAALRVDAATAARVAQEAARTFAGQAAIPGVGTAEWREMWESARTYSEAHAYPEHSFPHDGAGSHCVLCQQKLDRAAAERLTRFEEFVRGAAQANAAAKRTAAEEAGRKCLAVVPGERTKDALDDLAVLDAAVSEQAKQFIAEARRCRASISEGTSAASPVDSAPPLDELERLAAGLDARAEEMTKAADPAGRKRSEARRADLHARSVLAEIRPQIHAEIVRKTQMLAYEQAIRDTDTRAATKLSTDLTKKYVTDALTAAFDDELKRLGFTTLELELRPAGAQRGVLYHQVFLKHSTKAQLPKVVSEGESRCIALAAFLAEVRGGSHASAIVFDDPVSSLDHRWRSNVSRRLVEESKTRQVIVFTHEMVFLAALVQEAERQEVPYSPHTISRGSDLMSGHVEHGLPWHGLTTGKRISALKQELQRVEKIHREQGAKAYDPVATRMYADLRRTWERAVEEVLLNEVVLRFRQGIETSRLKKLGDITADDLKAVEAGMTRCSKWEGGHDQALAVNEPLPAPAELKADLEQLESWVTAVRKRRN